MRFYNFQLDVLCRGHSAFAAFLSFRVTVD